MPRRAIGVAAATVVALLVGAAPAAADSEIEVEAGYADGQFVPGRPLPVRVEVRSDQLVTGTLTATAYTLGQPGTPAATEVEVAGGSVKEYLLVLPTSFGRSVGPSEVRVTLRGGGESIEAAAPLTWSGTVELVGLLPGVAPQPPGPIDLDAGLGRALFHQLDDPELATPGAVGPLGSIVAGPGGLAALPREAQRNVLGWVEDGGQLLVDAPPGAAVAGLPPEWQPAATRAPAGEGWVRLTDGAAGRGQWSGLIEATRQFSTDEIGGMGWCCPASVPDAVARDAGLRIPEVGWLVGFLAAYVVIVGPVTYVVLRRARRTTLAWVAVPLVAVLFTGGAFVAGSSLRENARASHGSLVQASPLGDRVVSYVGLVSRDGSDPTAVFPERWQAGGFDPGPFGEMMAPGPVFDGGAAGGAPVPVRRDDGRAGVRLPLSAGDFGIVTGRGRVDDGGALSVTATAGRDGTVAGTVRNGSGVDLEEVIVVVSRHAVAVGDIPAGGSTEWSIDAGAPDPARDPWAPVEQPWSAAIGFEGTPDVDSIVNYSVYATELGTDVDAYAPGTVVAAGWTTAWQPPVEVGGPLAGGRTGIVARSPIAAESGTLPAAAVRRELVRGPGTTRFDPPVQVPDWGDAPGAVARFTLPEGADAATPLVLDASPAVVQAEVWDGRTWVPLALGDGQGGGDGADVAAGGGDAARVLPAPAGPAVVVGGPGLDPFGAPRQARLPAGVVRDGVVLVRVALVPDMPHSMVLQIRGAA
ncbi:MAG TPA: hypothetical protein VFZ77_04770 [Acidimicrobiales bacterium]